MPAAGKKSAEVLYHMLLKHFPETPSLSENEGVVLKFSDDRELHLNLTQNSSNSTGVILLNFYTGQEEDACYEISLDHSRRTAAAEIVRIENNQPLYSRLVQFGRFPLKSRSLLSPSGKEEINRLLFGSILRMLPDLNLMNPPKKAPPRFRKKGLEIDILQNTDVEATLAISPINIDGILEMTVLMDKKSQTAAVRQISGSFGRYPSYLPYPDGKEMLPHEREEFGQILLEKMIDLQGKNISK
ncbi:MAG: hypothetical protein LCH81_05665 [Bacteroidetes bacterium]|nr:hypothetical protein [Bacteroidota bacterium]